MSDQWEKLLQSIVVLLTVTALVMVVAVLFVPAKMNQRVERNSLSQLEKNHQTVESRGNDVEVSMNINMEQLNARPKGAEL